jgi:hypothetical protein
MFGCPDDVDKVIVPMDLIISKRYWEEFLSLVCGDKRLATELFSSHIPDRLNLWFGPGTGEPEVIRDLLAAVRAWFSDTKGKDKN